MITREEILANRRKWINYLKEKGRKKTFNRLDEGNGERCCLGHGCFILGLKRTRLDEGLYAYGKERADIVAPIELVNAVGLRDSNGSTYRRVKYLSKEFVHLADANDGADLSPQEIGAYLEENIEGGDYTPFKPLSDYPSKGEVK